jgi:hypothetical protein
MGMGCGRRASHSSDGLHINVRGSGGSYRRDSERAKARRSAGRYERLQSATLSHSTTREGRL